MAGTCASLRWSLAHTRNALRGCSLFCFKWGETYATQSAVIQLFQQYGGEYSFGGSAESHKIHLPSQHGREGSSFLGLSPPNDTVDSESVVGIQHGDCGVVIG